jgi:hypothetical protein
MKSLFRYDLIRTRCPVQYLLDSYVVTCRKQRFALATSIARVFLGTYIWNSERACNKRYHVTANDTLQYVQWRIKCSLDLIQLHYYTWPPLWSTGQSSWLYNRDVLCFLWGTNWIYICYVEESRPPLWSSGQSSWLHNGDVLCFLWGTNWIYICYVEESKTASVV